MKTGLCDESPEGREVHRGSEFAFLTIHPSVLPHIGAKKNKKTNKHGKYQVLRNEECQSVEVESLNN